MMSNDNEIQTDADGRRYIDLTPTWRAILPTWLMMLEQAFEGHCTNPDLIRANARAEFFKMADAADKWNAHCKLVEQLEASVDGDAA